MALGKRRNKQQELLIPTAQAERESGAELRAHVRERQRQTHMASRCRERDQTLRDPRRCVQSRTDHAGNPRGRDAEGPRGRVHGPRGHSDRLCSRSSMDPRRRPQSESLSSENREERGSRGDHPLCVPGSRFLNGLLEVTQSILGDTSFANASDRIPGFLSACPMPWEAWSQNS